MKKNSKQKKSKKHQLLMKKVKILFRLLLILIILVGIGIILFVTDIFKVTEITIIGNNKIETSVITEATGINEKSNIILLSENNIKKSILKNPYIREVEVKKQFPNKIEIVVKEDEESFGLKTGDGYVYIDNQGYILKISNSVINKPIIYGYETPENELKVGNRLNEKDLENLNIILQIVESGKRVNISDNITYIEIKDNEFIIYIQSDNKMIYLGDGSNISNRLIRARDIMDREKQKTGKVFVNGDFNNGFLAYFREEELKDIKK